MSDAKEPMRVQPQPDVFRYTNGDELKAAFAARKRSEIINAEEVAAKVKSKVRGQDAAVTAMATTLRRRSAQDNRGKPMAVFCLAGPPGVGKTYCAKIFADALKRPFKDFDMTQMGTREGSLTMLGAPESYHGSKGTLTTFLRDYPNGLVLLDEFEKAEPEVMRKFLKAWNDGTITEGRGGAEIDTTKSIWFLTTNAAYEAIVKAAQDYANQPDEMQKVSRKLLQDAKFPPEVLSRIDRVFAFMPLDEIDNARMVEGEIEKLVKSYRLTLAERSKHGVNGITLQVFERINERGESADGGVREVVRLIEEEIADHLIEAQEKGYEVVALSTDEAGKIIATGVASA